MTLKVENIEIIVLGLYFPRTAQEIFHKSFVYMYVCMFLKWDKR